MMIATVVFGWIAVGLATGYPIIFGYFQGAYPTLADEYYRQDIIFCASTTALLGLIAFPLTMFFTHFISSEGPQKWRFR